MNMDLAPILRKFALVFFDDTLIYTKSFEEHLAHVERVLEILLLKQWRVKLRKCDFDEQ